MSGLNTDTARVYETPDDANAIVVAAGAKIYQGALVGRTEDGRGRPLQAGDAAAGFATEPADNTDGAAGEKTARLKSRGKAALFVSGVSAADVGRKVYASDDNTFTLSASGNSFVVFVARFEKVDYAIVAFDFFRTEDAPAEAAAPAQKPTQNEGA
jgi:hypothetical protein